MEGKADAEPCSFCCYRRTELEYIDNGLPPDHEGHSSGRFCKLCTKTVGVAAFFNYHTYRHDIEVLRSQLFLANTNTDMLSECQANIGYIRRISNDLLSALAGYSTHVKHIDKKVELLMLKLCDVEQKIDNYEK